MASQRKTLAELRAETVGSLQQYVSETLTYIDAVHNFCGEKTARHWRLERDNELSTLKNIPKLEKDVQQKTLATVLKTTREGVKELTNFLDAVEKLAVTSLQVFTGGGEVVQLSLGISLGSVRDVISAARLVCPLLLRFKRDAEVFFQPSLHNLVIFEAELKTYIDTMGIICRSMKQSSAIGRGKPPRPEPQVQLRDLTLDKLRNISSHVDQLSDIRKDKDFRLAFLFQEESVSDFVDQFSACRPRMLWFLDDMEGCAVQLDRMKKGSEISSVASSSVGAVGGIMSIAGLILAPVTAGASIALTVGGLGLGVTSGVASAVTTVTEISVNEVQKKEASEDLERFMQDVDIIQRSLDKIINQRAEKLEQDNLDIAKGAMNVVKSVVGVHSNVREISKVCKTGQIAEQAAKGTFAATKVAASIGLNVLFIGLDIRTICEGSISLARGEQSEVSEFIRARAALLRSVVDCWTRIHTSVDTGRKKLESGKEVLQKRCDFSTVDFN